jgi:hypothetical protein
MANILYSSQAYEDWLREELRGEIVEKDLERKHAKMRNGAFTFLRASYWRWAETVLAICPELATAPPLLAVGDVHLENFGTWRDVDGRLIWGVNDFDEAAEMPYALDLLRLAASALVADAHVAADDACAAILTGYRHGLDNPLPVVLERDRAWLRELVVVPEKERAKFWKKLEAATLELAPARYRMVLAAAMPEPSLEIKTARRVAGVGSLGRPRWVGRLDNWRGGPVVREAKALIVSSWYRVHSPGMRKITCAAIAGTHHRAPDPWYAVKDEIVVRRLSPNNRKIEAADGAFAEVSAAMLEVMGIELANVHLGSGDASPITADLASRKQGWLAGLAKKMAKATTADYQEFCRH